MITAKWSSGKDILLKENSNKYERGTDKND